MKTFWHFICQLTLILLCYPVDSFAFSGGDGSKIAPYVISEVSDWDELSKSVTDNPMTTYDKYYILTNDITVDYCIGAYNNKVFYGNIDGNGHTILINLDVKYSYMTSVGVFSSINNASIKNLTVKGIINMYQQTADIYLGGFCGKSVNSSFINCTNQVTFDYTNCDFTRIVYAGGFCGSATSSEFLDCSNKSSISAIGPCDKKYVGGIVASSENCIYKQCSNIGSLTGKSAMSNYQPDNIYTGGLVGMSTNDNFTNCFNSGNITTTLEIDRYSGYLLLVDSYTGGLVGYSNGSEISTSYNIGSVAGTYADSFSNRYTPFVGGIYGCASSMTTKAYSCFVDCTLRVTTDGRYGLIGGGGEITNCFATTSCIVNKGSGAVGYGYYAQCEKSDVRSSDWLTTTLSFDFNQYWWQSTTSSLPELKLMPIININSSNLIYGVALQNFATSNNSLSSLEISSIDGKLDISNTTIIPVSTGTASVRIAQQAKDQWKGIDNIYKINIASKDLYVMGPKLSCQYGADIPSIELSYDGFVLGNTISDFITKPVVNCDATKNSDVGSYPIIVGGGFINNYNLKYFQGELSIIKADQTIEWDQRFNDIKVGESIILSARTSSELPITYLTSDESIARIEIKGETSYLKALRPGEVNICAIQVGNKNYNATDSVVRSLKVISLISDIKIAPESAILKVEESLQLTTTILPSNATNKSIIWSSSDETIATVDPSGLVSALSQGSAVITARSTDGSDVSATCEITVRRLVTDIYLNESEATLNEGEAFQLVASVSPETAGNKALQWSSSNDGVATVDPSGLVTAISQGSAVITVRSTDGSDVSAECLVKVTYNSGVTEIIADGYTISTEPFIVNIHGANEDTVIRVFDIDGNMLYIGNDTRIEVTKAGVYILLVQNKIFKIKI